MNETFPPILWLLESKIPSIRYKTYKNLLGYPADHPDLMRSYKEIQISGPVPDILDQQALPGQWPYLDHFYTPKYVSTHWSMMLLEELCVDPKAPRFQAGAEFMLTSTHTSIQNRLDSRNSGFSCLWGNILRYVIHAGFIDDPRTTEMIALLSAGLTEAECACTSNGNLSCSWGAVRTLWGLSAVPQDKQTPELKTALQTGVSFLFEKYSLPQANFPVYEGGRVHSLWSKLSFPLYYQSDILFTLRVLSELKLLSGQNVQPSLLWLQSQQKTDGRFGGSNPFHKRAWPVIADREDTNRWVSLQALDVLKQAGLLI
jgi:hypothetical protein